MHECRWWWHCWQEHQVRTKGLNWLSDSGKLAVKADCSGCVEFTSMVGNWLLGPIFIFANRVACSVFPHVSNYTKNGLCVSF